MSSTRPRRATATDQSASPRASTSKSRGRPKRVVAKAEPDVEVADEQDDEEDAEDADAGPSSRPAPRGRGRSIGSRGRGRGRKAAIVPHTDGVDEDAMGTEAEAESEELNEDVIVTAAGRRKAARKVSYKEIPVKEVEEAEDDEEDDDAEGEDDEDGEGEEDETQADGSPHRKRIPPTRFVPSSTHSTPRKRSKFANSKADDLDDKADRSYKREVGVGSGRGGFSVKGAAAAAARARWEKVRREKAERGDDSDGDRERKKREKGRRETRAALDSVEVDSVVTIKGVEYTVGDDELILPDDPKGETKIDAEGHLLGGREYKLVTFTSPSRRNPNRVYALTIDAARACGYSDSLAFLRRCPQALKLACNAEERQMLIDIGRVTGNLKHRMVTMISMRNVFKMMGARVVKNGKWVTDDYNEEEALAQCTLNGWTPNTPAHDDDIVANALATLGIPGRPNQPSNRMVDELNPYSTSTRSAPTHFSSLAPFYTLGGPTTTFGGSGVDLWSDAGWGNKRAKLKGSGISDEDWMFRLASDCRRVDKALRESRADRLKVLEGVDGIRGWVYSAEKRTEGIEGGDNENEKKGFEGVVEGSGFLKAPTLNRVRSQLSQEVNFPSAGGDASNVSTPMTAIEEDGDTKMEENGEAHEERNGDPDPEIEKTPGGKIIVQSPEEEESMRRQLKYIVGGSWKPGIVHAVYEPHTQMPHIPLHTQPINSSFSRLTTYPLLSPLASDMTKGAPIIPAIQNSSVKGLASLEYVFEPGFEAEIERDERLRMVKEAEDWARISKEKRKGLKM